MSSFEQPNKGKAALFSTPMTSKHYRWQALWQIDQEDGMAVHDSGLRVRLKDGSGEAENAGVVVLLLVPDHREHNAHAMVQRLVRQGAQLLIDPHSRGWRGKAYAY